SEEARPWCGWSVGVLSIRPGVVVVLPSHAVAVQGILEWELIVLPSPFKSDTWVTSMEILPGDPSVVHHICFSFEKHLPATVYNRNEWRSEEHTSELQSRVDLVCRLLLEKKKQQVEKT